MNPAPTTCPDYAQQLEHFHDWTGHRFSAVTDAAAILEYIKARLGDHSPFAQDFQAAARAEGKIQ